MHCISHLSCDGHLPRQEVVDKMKKTNAGGSKLSFGGFGEVDKSNEKLFRTSSKAASSVETALKTPSKEVANLQLSLKIESSASYTSLTQDETGTDKQLKVAHKVVSDQRIEKIVDGIRGGKYPLTRGFQILVQSDEKKWILKESKC